MTLLAPALLAGLVALGIPIAAHLLGRAPPQTISFAAIRFLTADDPTVTRRRKLQHPWLLAVRLALLAFAILVLARPAALDAGGLAIVAEPHDAVLLVDSSASMSLRIGDERLLARAEQRAAELLASLPEDTRIGLLTSDPDGPRLEPTADRERVADALSEWVGAGAPRLGAWTMMDALPRAVALLGDAGADRKRVVYALGDATTGGLADLPSTTPEGALVIPIVAHGVDATPPEHVGIVDVTWTAAPDIDPRAVRIEAIVRRHGGESGTLSVGVALRIAGSEVTRATIDLEPDAAGPIAFTHVLLGEESTVAATIELDLPDDPLGIDDVRHVWLSADDAIDVVIVNGSPSELRAHDEVFFLATAVGVADRQQRLRVVSLSPDQLDGRIREQAAKALADIDVLVLANTGAPAPDVTPAIVDAVSRGMGLWITVGDRVDPSAYNDRLGTVLPLLLRETVEVGTAPGLTEQRVEGFAPPDLAHPVFRGWGGELGLTGARVRKVVLCEPDPTRGAAIALAYTSGAPALVTRDSGDGKVALLTTTVDRDWADLPLRPGFVPLAAAVLEYLGDGSGGARAESVFVGEPRRLRSGATVSVTTPDGRTLPATSDTAGVTTFRETFLPGHYRATDDGELVTFTVAVDPRESDTAWQPIEREDATGTRAAVALPRWRPLVVVVALLLGLESLLRLGRARRRRAD
jgi:hypothetical protein